MVIFCDGDKICNVRYSQLIELSPRKRKELQFLENAVNSRQVWQPRNVSDQMSMSLLQIFGPIKETKLIDIPAIGIQWNVARDTGTGDFSLPTLAVGIAQW